MPSKSLATLASHIVDAPGPVKAANSGWLWKHQPASAGAQASIFGGTEMGRASGETGVPVIWSTRLPFGGMPLGSEDQEEC